jgi:Raf kinase inhibitor-like YbhB/YbcL family protein
MAESIAQRPYREKTSQLFKTEKCRKGMMTFFEQLIRVKRLVVVTYFKCDVKSSIRFWLWAGIFLVLTTASIGCSNAASQRSIATLELRSTSLLNDDIPRACSSCDHQDGASPELSWSTPPEGTESFALIVFDKDSPLGFKFTHWVLYDIPADKREVPENIARQEQLSDGSRQGPNDYDRIGYLGPCPPGHSLHHYVFDLYALDTKLNLYPRASKKQVLKAIKGHILASGELVGRFQH